ncbi:hypothetical protein [Gilvimarinus japonicus]|uniref:Uncharacterized protein n=1 Tax=Gilvimarinus japonicus TaxID=1796469 RepID=A0ABV7HPH1_9GAMM
MFDTVFASFRWLGSLGAKFFRVAPGPTLFVIPATLVSQVSMLLASLLPLKVLILIGSDGVPRYLSQDFIQLDRDTLIISLCIATPAFYLLHLASERLIHWASNLGAKRLLAQSKKIVLFENQDDLAASSYRRYAGGLANTVFIACVWVALGFVFPSLCILVISYTVLCLLGIGLAYKVNSTLRQRIEDNLTSLVPILTAVGFLMAFLLLVVEFLSGAAQGFLFAIISVLLARQAFNRKKQLVAAIIALYTNRRKLNALFFKGHALTQADDQQMEFWTLFAPQAREGWLRELLIEQLSITPERLRINWHQTGVNDLVALEIEAHDSEDTLLGRYLIRLYGRTPSLLASHEATLLLDDTSEHLPALPLLATGQVGKWHCHILSLPSGFVSVNPIKHLKHYLTALWEYTPPEDLAARYARSHPMLWQRLDASVIERLYMAADNDDRPLVRELEERLPTMLATLKTLPLVVVNPSITVNTLLQNAEGELRVTYWGNWRLEPLGIGWPLGKKSLADLPRGLQRAGEQRPELKSVDAQAVVLAALLFKFDEMCNKQLYQDALALIPQLLEARCSKSALNASSQIDV